MLKKIFWGATLFAFLCCHDISLQTAVAAETGSGFVVDLKKERDLPTHSAAVAVTWSPDSLLVAAASDYGADLTIWDLRGRPVKHLSRSGGGPALDRSLVFLHGSADLIFSPSADASSDAALQIWDVDSGNIIGSIRGPYPSGDAAQNRSGYFDVSLDKRLLVCGSSGSGNKVTTYNSETFAIRNIWTSDDGIFSLAVFGTNPVTAVGLGNGVVKILSPISGQEIKTISVYGASKFGRANIGARAGSPSGEYLFSGIGQVVLAGQFINDKNQTLWLDGLTPAGIFRIADGARLFDLSDARGPVRKAAWDPKGRFVAFTDNAGSLILWNPTGTNASYVKIA